MRTLEKTVLWIYTLLFSLLMVLLTLISTGWKQPLFAMDFALTDMNQRFFIGISGIILFVLGIYVLFFYARSKPANHTVVKTTQMGEICISLDTIEALVIKSAGRVLGMREIKAVIKPTEQGVAILIKGTVNAEENIPQTSVEVQETVKGTVEAIAGVPVLEVKVFIQGVTKELRSRVE